MWRALYIILWAGCAAKAAAVRDLPVFFIANHGQAPAEVRFMAKDSGLTAWFLGREVLLRAQDEWVHLRFEGASPLARLEGADPLPGRANFLTGRARQWHRDVPLFAAVRYRELCPGIDMIYGGPPSSRTGSCQSPWEASG